MKKLLMLLSVTAFLACNVFSQSWFQQQTGTSQSINVIEFTSASTGFCAGPAGKIYRTTNGGSLWTEITTNHSGQVYAMCFPNASTGYATGESGRIIKTTNGGLNWTELITNEGTMLSILFTDANTGYVGGIWSQQGQILKTTNAGVNWTFQIATSSLIYSIKNFPGSSSILYACGATGIVIRSSNYGEAWDIISAPTNHVLLSIQPFTLNGVITAGDNVICRSSNSGNSWVNVPVESPAYLNDIQMVNASTGFAAGKQGRIFKTYDGGLSWHRLGFYDNVEFNSVYFINETTGYFARNDGIIIKTTNGGGSPIGIEALSGEIPAGYSLAQNYPNPFNPETNIKFSIPGAEFVSLIIYDITGAEIKKMVNKTLSAGTYNYRFDASHYPSGVYFYRISSGDYTEAKKMTLIK